MSIGRYTRNSVAGIVNTDEGGVIKFSEDVSACEYAINMQSANGEQKRFVVTEKELEGLATIALITHSTSIYDLEENENELRDEYRKEQNHRAEAQAQLNRKMEAAFGPSMPSDLDAAYDEAHRPLSEIYGDPLGGGDGTPDYYAVEGWGIQRLDNGDFEVTSYGDFEVASYKI